MGQFAFASRTLQKHERDYEITELEALGHEALLGHGCDVYIH